MTEQTAQGETPEVEVQATPEAVEVEEEKFDEARAKELIAKLRLAEKKGKADAKRLADFEADELKRQEAAKSDLQKAQDALTKVEREKREIELRLMRRDAAAKAKLPQEFVDRLKGETLEELEADAEALAKAIPAPIPPKGQPTNPGQPQTGETEAERRKRLGL